MDPVPEECFVSVGSETLSFKVELDAIVDAWRPIVVLNYDAISFLT